MYRSYALRDAITTDIVISAALGLNECRGGSDDGVRDIEALATALDQYQLEERDVPFWRHVYNPSGESGLVNVALASRAIKETVASLRRIAAFKMGEITEMKRFCHDLTEALLREEGRALYDYERRYLAA